MQVIGHLIRFDAYQARLDFVQSASKGGNIHLGKMLGERFSYSGIFALPVWLGTSNGILPETGLGYVCPHRSTTRSEEHTSELQSRLHLVCRLLLEKKKNS